MKLTALLPLLAAVPLLAQGPVLTYHNDNLRTGWYAQESQLTPANVNPAHFGKLFTLPSDGKVDAAPLYVPALVINTFPHNVVFVASENDTVYAYDADRSGSPLWQVSLLGAGETPSDPRGCGQVSPQIGITATPAIDLAAGPHGTMYVVAMTRDSAGKYHHRIHALDLTSGAEQFGGPVEVKAAYPGAGAGSQNGKVSFDPGQYKERPALLLTNGVLVTSWSSHCDYSPYTGWVVTYDERTLTQLSVLNFTPNGSEGSVWQSGGGPAADAAGNIYFLAANGTFDTTLTAAGFPNRGDYGNAFLKLSNSNNHLAVADYFTMSNTVAESSTDEDLGSGAAMLLPDLPVGGAARHLAVGAGKDRNLYVVDRDNMGRFNPVANNIFQEIPGFIAGGEFGAPAYANGTVYFGGSNDAIRAFPFVNGRFLAGSRTGNQFGYPGATPALSSLASANTILWAAENTSPAVLHAYDAANLATELYNSNQAGTRDQFGNGNKFITPVIANGKVYVGTQTGVGVFGLLSPQKIVRINCGGALIGSFAADTAFVGGNATDESSSVRIDTSRVTNPAPAAVYASKRTGNKNQGFFYQVQNLTPQAAYHVRLHFAEFLNTVTGPGQRLFNVAINGTAVLTSFDIFAEVGKFEADIKEFDTTADAQGRVRIDYTYGAKGNPTANGIEILAK